ncbi:UDP-glucose/GDP-mannose dehydrogenase family protein [Oscillibacter valericigenes Sjm18-20]|nr:UDP-glucose/GDP-mannose dehydrogenase family protein [Oscillibacter valericigenes Sjm18-20]
MQRVNKLETYVLGLGHVGLPMACWIALSGSHVFGIDVDEEAIHRIKAGEIKIEEYYRDIHISSLAQTLIESNKLDIGTKLVRESDKPSAFLISVGMRDLPDGKKDLSPILAAIDCILSVLVPNDLIILRSTMIPGTCENVIAPRLRERNVPFYLAYCPETMMETRAFEEFEKNPMILAGIDEGSYQAAGLYWQTITKNKIYKASNIRTAEMAKVVQNIHRDVNIALANEISDAAAALNIDGEDLRALANVNPRVSMLVSGPGVGGYCLPNALAYLRVAVPEISLTLAETARELNRSRPAQIAQITINALESAGKQVNGAVIAVGGLAMKNYCADTRSSPALEIIKELEARGATVKAYDPLVPKSYPFQKDSFEECLKNADCLVITAKQKALPYNVPEIIALMASPAVIIDTQRTVHPMDGVSIYRV